MEFFLTDCCNVCRNGLSIDLVSRLQGLWTLKIDTKSLTWLLVVWRHLIIDVSQKRYLHLRGVVPSKYITNKVCLYLHLYLKKKLVISYQEWYLAQQTWAILDDIASLDIDMEVFKEGIEEGSPCRISCI